MRKWIFVLFIISLNGDLWAQEQDEWAVLDSIYKTLDLDNIVVTAQYAPTAAENAIHPVKVIRAEEIQAQGQLNLSEVLTNQLNLRISSDPFLGSGLRIQGVGGENVQIMIDGVPVVGRLNGNIDLSQINLHNVQRIEVVEGAMSAIYGSNAAGGVVNIITKKSQVRPFTLNSSNQYESIGILNNSLTIGGQWKGFYASVSGARNNYEFAPVDSLRVLETINLPDGETFTTKKEPWNPKLQYNLDGTLRYRRGDSLSVTYQYRYFTEELASYGEMRRPQFRPYAFDDYYLTDRQDHSLALETYLLPNLYLNSVTAYNQYDRIVRAERFEFEHDTSSLVMGEQDTTAFNTLLHRSILSTANQGRLNGQVGIELLLENGQGRRIVDSTTTPINESEIHNYAIWGSLQYELRPGLLAQANLRYGYNSKYDHPLIPSLQLRWQPRLNWDIKLGYAQGFRAPTLKELHFNFIDINHYIIGNKALEAEHAHNLSLVVKNDTWRRPNQSITSTLRLFYNDIDNRITLAEFEPLRFNYQNVDRFRTTGANLQFDVQWWENVQLTLGGAYTLLSNSWSDDYEEADDFTGLYEMQNQLSISAPRSQTQLVVNHRFIGQQARFYLEEDVLLRGTIGGYHLVNMTLSQQLWDKRIFVAAGVKNLFDTDSIPITGAGDGGAHSAVGDSQLIGWGRTFFVRAQFNL